MPGGQPPVSFLISAEHASNAIPQRWTSRFEDDVDVLETHRAWDPGSLPLTRALAQALGAPLIVGRWSRLLVDLNRSEAHPRRFSEFTRDLPEHDRQELTESIWRPHWQAYAARIGEAPGLLIHLACHSFTPVLEGKTRTTDIGLLHDPSRPDEDAVCKRLQKAIQRNLPTLAVHRNRPYRGTSDGLGSWHRKHYDDTKLITMEIELNQRFATGPEAVRVRDAIVAAARETLLTVVAS